jgi:predicted transcriptional regulator
MAPAQKDRTADRSSPIEQLAALDAPVRRGVADAEAGRIKSAEEVFDRLESKYRDLAGH